MCLTKPVSHLKMRLLYRDKNSVLQEGGNILLSGTVLIYAKISLLTYPTFFYPIHQTESNCLEQNVFNMIVEFHFLKHLYGCKKIPFFYTQLKGKFHFKCKGLFHFIVKIASHIMSYLYAFLHKVFLEDRKRLHTQWLLISSGKNHSYQFEREAL